MSVLSDHAEPSQAASCETFKRLCVIGLGDRGRGQGTEMGTKKSVFKRKKINEHNSREPFGWSMVLGHIETPFPLPFIFFHFQRPLWPVPY